MSSKRKAEEPLETEEDAEIQNINILGEGLVGAILDNQPEEALKSLIAAAPLWYQNEEEGISCLHAAAYMRNPRLIKSLIEKGAIWNAIDKLGNTAGDIALSFNDTECYTIIRDAGIRQELLLNLLSAQAMDEEPDDTVLHLKAKDETGAGDTQAYLSSKLTFKHDSNGQEVCVIRAGDEEVGVMMGWEREIMEQTVAKLVQEQPSSGDLKVLNVGFGLGIIDDFFQSLSPPPALHVIIEAHPDVLAHMRRKGWYERPNVKILEGKWQDVIDDPDILQVGGFDAVYTDTFSEDYAQLHQFFEKLPDLLSGPSSRFSFFNGLGATNTLFYDVYTRVAELNLTDIGLDVQWSDVEVQEDRVLDKWGGTRKYFSLPIYRLPVAALRTM